MPLDCAIFMDTMGKELLWTWFQPVYERDDVSTAYGPKRDGDVLLLL